MEFKRKITIDEDYTIATITSKITLKEGKTITLNGDTWGSYITLSLKETSQLISFLEEAVAEIEKEEVQNG